MHLVYHYCHIDMHRFDDDDNQAFEALLGYCHDSSSNVVVQPNEGMVLLAVVVVPKNQVKLYDDDMNDPDDMVDPVVVVLDYL